MLALPGPVTAAIMPDTPHATEFAREAHRAGKIVILHMPMAPATGPFAWHPELPIEELEKRLNAAFKVVPYTAGINNHMGSRMTAQPAAMAWLMGDLQRRHKFFVDSRTSAQTVAAAQAQKICIGERFAGCVSGRRADGSGDLHAAADSHQPGARAGFGSDDRASVSADAGGAGA